MGRIKKLKKRKWQTKSASTLQKSTWLPTSFWTLVSASSLLLSSLTSKSAVTASAQAVAVDVVADTNHEEPSYTPVSSQFTGLEEKRSCSRIRPAFHHLQPFIIYFTYFNAIF